MMHTKLKIHIVGEVITIPVHCCLFWQAVVIVGMHSAHLIAQIFNSGFNFKLFLSFHHVHTDQHYKHGIYNPRVVSICECPFLSYFILLY